jgi:D-3-phosphoglycerate dehydrogenase
MSTSPGAAGSFGGRSLKAFGTARQLQAFLPAAFPAFPEEEGTATPRTGKIKILLLENISLEAAQFLKNAGYEVSRSLR